MKYHRSGDTKVYPLSEKEYKQFKEMQEKLDHISVLEDWLGAEKKRIDTLLDFKQDMLDRGWCLVTMPHIRERLDKLEEITEWWKTWQQKVKRQIDNVIPGSERLDKLEETLEKHQHVACEIRHGEAFQLAEKLEKKIEGECNHLDMVSGECSKQTSAIHKRLEALESEDSVNYKNLVKTFNERICKLEGILEGCDDLHSILGTLQDFHERGENEVTKLWDERNRIVSRLDLLDNNHIIDRLDQLESKRLPDLVANQLERIQMLDHQMSDVMGSINLAREELKKLEERVGHKLSDWQVNEVHQRLEKLEKDDSKYRVIAIENRLDALEQTHEKSYPATLAGRVESLETSNGELCVHLAKLELRSESDTRFEFAQGSLMSDLDKRVKKLEQGLTYDHAHSTEEEPNCIKCRLEKLEKRLDLNDEMRDNLERRLDKLESQKHLAHDCNCDISADVKTLREKVTKLEGGAGVEGVDWLERKGDVFDELVKYSETRHVDWNIAFAMILREQNRKLDKIKQWLAEEYGNNNNEDDDV